MLGVRGFGFRVSGSGFSGSRFRVSGLGGLGFWGFRVQISGFGWRKSGFRVEANKNSLLNKNRRQARHAEMHVVAFILTYASPPANSIFIHPHTQVEY